MNYIKNMLMLFFLITPFKIKGLSFQKRENISNTKYHFLSFCFSKKIFFGLSCLVIDIFMFSLSLVFLYLLFQISFQNNSVHTFNYLSLLGLIVIGKYLLSTLRLYLDVLLRRNIISILQTKFIISSWKHENASVIARLISRDTTILLDFISNATRFLYFPIAISLMLSAMYLLEGVEGIIALSSVSVFLLLSWFIGKKSAHFANKIYSISKNRIDQSSWFLNFRPYLKNWNELESLAKIEKITLKEVSYRNKDSFIRSLDLYTILFGCALPVLILLIIGVVLGKEIDHYLIIALWFATPMIALIMEMGRFSSDYTVANRAFNELQENFKINISSASHEFIELNDEWEIWSGSLAENLLHKLSPNNLSLISELQLEDELKARNQNVLDMPLEFLGKNLSQGQKTRVLLIRAIHLSIATKKPLAINISLNSLDPITCRNLYALIPKLHEYCQINLSKSQHTFFQEQMTRCHAYERFHTSGSIENLALNDENTQENITNSSRNSFFHHYKNLMPIIGLFFTIPALFLSLNGYVISSNFSLETKIILLLLTTTVSIIAAPSLGFFIESTNRKKAILSQINLLQIASLKNMNDLLQRLSKDFTVMVERISWYIHDIAWYKALILISFFAIIYTSGYKGVIINVLFLGIIVWICSIFSNSILRARIGAVEGMNQSIDSLQNLTTLGHIDIELLAVRRANWAHIGFKKLIDSHVKMVITKSNFSNLIAVSTGIFITIIVAIASLAKLPRNETVFLLTSLLAMEATIVNLFQALTGLNAQLLSYMRLVDLPVEEAPIPNQKKIISQEDNSYTISNCINPKLNMSYNALTITKGVAYSLSGSSGKGKSEYLKTISNFNDSVIAPSSIKQKSHHIKTMYLGEKSIELLQSLNKPNLLNYVTNKIIDENYKIIILDETFRGLAVSEAQTILRDFSDLLKKTKASLILVDHRFELENNQISIHQIINK